MPLPPNDPRRKKPLKPRFGSTPGVGYTPPEMSYAGTSHGHQPVKLDASWSIDPARRPDGTPCPLHEALAGRYAAGNRAQWAAGAPGSHTPEQLLRDMFAAGLLGDRGVFNGEPTLTESNDAVFGQAGDPRIQQWLAKIGGDPGTDTKTTPAAGDDALLRDAQNLLLRLEGRLRGS